MGSQWFNRIGIVAVLIGVAWFLKFAFDNHWVGPAGRVLIGLLSGAALIAWSERFRSKGYTAFSYSLKAVGSGVLYLSLWAAFSMYHLIPSGVAFAGMVLVTAFNAFIAWRQSAELLAVYAIVGAFSTPLLLSTGRNEEVFLFSYLLMMNAATMALLVLKGWNRLLVLSFLGTVGFYWGWYWRGNSPSLRGGAELRVRIRPPAPGPARQSLWPSSSPPPGPRAPPSPSPMLPLTLALSSPSRPPGPVRPPTPPTSWPAPPSTATSM